MSDLPGRPNYGRAVGESADENGLEVFHRFDDRKARLHPETREYMEKSPKSVQAIRKLIREQALTNGEASLDIKETDPDRMKLRMSTVGFLAWEKGIAVTSATQIEGGMRVTLSAEPGILTHAVQDYLAKQPEGMRKVWEGLLLGSIPKEKIYFGGELTDPDTVMKVKTFKYLADGLGYKLGEPIGYPGHGTVSMSIEPKKSR